MSLLLLLAGPALAASFYVAPGGDDASPGSEAKPFATVQKGVDAAKPGDTVYLRGGVYETRYPILMRRSGEPGRPITLAAFPGEAPRIRFLEPASGKHPRLELKPAKPERVIGWLVIEGLDVSGGYEGVKFYNAHDVVIRGNDIHDNLLQGILGIGGARVSIVKNRIRRNGSAEASPGGSRDNKLHGVYATGSDYSVLDNLFDQNWSWGLQVAGYPYDKALHAGPEYAGASGWVIKGNVFARSVNRSGIVMWQPGAKDSVIEGNVFYDNALGKTARAHAVDFYYSGRGHVLRDNVFRYTGEPALKPVTDTWRGASYTETGSRDEDPGFKDPAGGDFSR